MSADNTRRRLQFLRAELKQVSLELARLKRDQRACKRNLEVVISSAYCPVCLQPLSLEYKYEYTDKMGAIFREIEKKIAGIIERQESLEQEIRGLEEALGDTNGG
ncbi:MAG: hypothetical protein QW514_07500 [Thermoprotei archaeon]